MVVSEIKDNLKGRRLVIGTAVALKSLKAGRVSKVFLSSNCPGSVRRDVDYYCSLGGCAVEVLDIPNTDLGVLCKKPFSVSIVGLLKQ